jgi:carboxyl-terminal processing protease
MTIALRGLLIAALIAVGAVGAALYFGHVRQAAPRLAVGGGTEIAATGDAQNVLASQGDSRLVDEAFRRIESLYYRPIDAQVLLDGERSGLLAYLKARHVRSTIPTSTASDEAGNETTLAQTLSYAQTHYDAALGKDAGTQLTQAALRGLLQAPKDPYTVYLSPREISGMDESLNGGDFGGIGVYIEQLKDLRIFLLPIQGMPAAGAGVKPGDVVVRIDGENVRGLSLDRVQAMLRGNAGTTVRVTAYPYNAPTKLHTVAIVRQNIHIPTVKAKMENGYDYIRLSDFGQTSADEIRSALLYGKSNNAKGYILDLRDNGGGYVNAAVAISSYFIAHGTIVSTIDRSGTQVDTQALGDAIDGLQPLVVLVNKYTASASEITAGALQDYRLATILGTKTFGKGVVQTVYLLDRDGLTDQGAVKITTYRYVTPLGRDIQHKGITPDILVNQSTDPALIDTPADKQLAAAKARLKQMIR